MGSLRKFVASLVLCIALTSTNSVAESIDVLVVFSSDTNLSLSQKLSKAVSLSLDANAALLASGITGRSFEFAALPTTVPYNATNKHPREAIRWMKAKNAVPTHALSVAREASFPGGADLIYMVVSDWTTDDCGYTDDEVVPRPPPSISTIRSEEYAFAASALNANPDCDDEIVVPHELGHLLYAEDDPILNSSGNPVDDNNNSLSQPKAYNHGIIAANGDRTIMVNPATSDSVVFFSGSLPHIKSTHADVKKLITQDAWHVVAAYRSPPPPPDCQLVVDFNGCHATLQYTVTALLPGYTVTNMDMDYRYGTTGPWQDWFDGIFTCPGFNTPVVRTIRAILTTAAGVSQCQVYAYPQICDDEPW